MNGSASSDIQFSDKLSLRALRLCVSALKITTEYKVKAVTGLRPYSVYSQSSAWCLDHGGALRCLNGWRESKVKIVEE